jgi:sec-independent protein translocase protein TatA
MYGLGVQELVIILAIVGILFGGKKLPELGRGIGQAIKGFKKSVSETEEDLVTHQKPPEGSAEKGK